MPRGINKVILVGGAPIEEAQEKAFSKKRLNQYQLADRFNVSQACIGSIVRNETWRHVNGE